MQKFIRKQYFYLKNKFKIFHNNKKILEIASNDGSLQDFYKEKGIDVIGVEPSRFPYKIAKKKGHIVYNKFFNLNLIKKKKLKSFDLIILNNVISHTPDPLKLIENVNKILTKEKGIIIITFMNILKEKNSLHLDMLYHGNYYYPTEFTILKIAKKLNLRCIDVYQSKFLDHSTMMILTNSREYGESLFLKKKNLPNMRVFEKKMEMYKDLFINFLIKNKDKNIILYGISAKASTLISLLGSNTKLIYGLSDINSNRWDKYLLGTSLKVISPSKLKTLDKNLLVIVMAWNIFPEIKKFLRTKISLECSIINIQNIIN